jgi:hypothetical protein
MGIFLVIHMDPVEVNDSRIIEKKQAVVETVKGIEPKATIHDFRMVNGEEQINLIFDLVVPYSYDEKQEEQLKEKIQNALQAMDERYQAVITIENSYIAD